MTVLVEYPVFWMMLNIFIYKKSYEIFLERTKQVAYKESDCTLIPRIQAHVLICVAEAKMHALKCIYICHFLALRKIDVFRI